ncbi:MAG: NUDIX domain-containing protein [Chloroflexota bacterium]|nr:NUDIX domain-containing protein [Chloroflexota bacterium]MDE2899051.1 NUDIX domain-containing protein [Chloroflexota bacterium]
MSERIPAYAGIRPVALAVIRDGSRLLVREYRTGRGGRYYRPLGGAIYFGERGADAVRREIREEIGEEILGVRHLGTLENIFEREGQAAHWIVLLFEAEFVDRSRYANERIEGVEGDGERIEARWIDVCQPLGGPLYPEGLLELLMGSESPRVPGR